MKARSLFYLFLPVGFLFFAPAACSNDSETGGDGDGDGDALGGQGGASTGGGDGDINIGDGDGDTGIGGSGDGDGTFPTQPPECGTLGTGCDGEGDCCSGYCDDAAGECSCGPAGRDCVVGSDCCSGQCNPLTFKCAQVLGTCAQEDTPCASGTECCTLSCVDGFCSADACVIDGEACGADGACCSGACGDGGTCETINDGSCASAGNLCDDGGDCCSGLCNDEGTCSIGASYCIQRGDVCNSDGQCCQGVCDKAEGAATGYCATQETGGTNCGERLISGEVCGGDCAECCSRTCAPYGPSGATICQPATGCRPDGELCRSADDCCGGNPNSSIPGAGQAECLREHPDDTVGRCKVTGCNPHGAICGSPDDGTTSCTGSLSAPNGRSCCEKQGIDQPCVADSLLVPRCNVLTECVMPEGECATADDCCNGNPCVQNSDGLFTCFDTTDGCVESGGPCTASADCCVGSTCILEPGQATGVCGNDDPPGGMGGNPGSGGNTGSGGSTSSGGNTSSGGSTTVCAEYGQSCQADGDCCGDVPCDPVTDTCRYPIVVR